MTSKVLTSSADAGGSGVAGGLAVLGLRRHWVGSGQLPRVEVTWLRPLATVTVAAQRRNHTGFPSAAESAKTQVNEGFRLIARPVTQGVRRTGTLPPVAARTELTDPAPVYLARRSVFCGVLGTSLGMSKSLSADASEHDFVGVRMFRDC